MADGKWISELTALTPVADAARRVLTVRFEVVHHYLPLAVREAAKDPEYVHQLRVGTRRAGAALLIFRDHLPDKEYRQARRELRKIRRAAGEARDWDVFLLALMDKHRQAPSRQRPGLDCLIGTALARRELAQANLAETGPDYPFILERLQADTVAAIRNPHGRTVYTLGQLARPMLASLLAELDEAVARDLDDYTQLHRVRIIGKRLRYAMEVFADCFDSSFKDQLYPAVEEMQEILGNANDSHVAAQRLTELRDALRKSWPEAWKRFRSGIEGLLRFHLRRLPQERKRFLAWWKTWQESGGENVFASLVNELRFNHRPISAPRTNRTAK
jgi:CHAD domain-containing protein